MAYQVLYGILGRARYIYLRRMMIDPAHAHAHARASGECARVTESPADTVNLVVTNYPEMYLDVNRAAFKKHTDLQLLFVVCKINVNTFRKYIDAHFYGQCSYTVWPDHG